MKKVLAILLCLTAQVWSVPAHKPRTWMMKPPLGSTVKFGHPLAKGLISAFLLNEQGGNVLNDLVTGNLATMQNVSSPWVRDSLGSANTYNFNTANWAKEILNKRSPPFTVVAIAAPSSIGSSDGWGVCAHDGGANGWGLELSPASPAVMRIDVIGTAYTSFTNLTVAIANQSKYHLMAMVIPKTTGNATGYLGILGSTITTQTIAFTGTIGTAPTQFEIGNENAAATDFLGNISVVYYWNRVLSVSEINAINMNPYAIINLPSPGLWWITPKKAATVSTFNAPFFGAEF
jgi:hypothetical protein